VPTPASAWHLYLIRTKDGSLYTGIATNVARRFAEHQAQGNRCARYLRGRAPLRLVFQRPVGRRSLALKAERRLRRLRKKQKEEIARSRVSAQDLLLLLALRPGGTPPRTARATGTAT
jgi:putative endonuclease